MKQQLFSKVRPTPQRFLSFLLLSLLLSCSALNEPSYRYQSHQIKDSALIIETAKGQVRFESLADGAIEVIYLDTDVQHPSFAKKENLSSVKPQVNEANANLVLTNGQLKAVIEKSDLSVAFYRNDQLLIEQQDYFNEAKRRGFNFQLASEEKILGGGERVLGMDRRGHRMPLYNRAHYGYTTESNQMYFSVPMVMSDKKYALLYDNAASGFLDIAKTRENTLTFESVGGRSAYIVFAGDTYPDLLQNYIAVTGAQPLPPRWSLGNYASRFGYKTEQEVRETVAKFFDEDFPLDAVILDLYWFGPDIKGHVGNLDWDKKAFPTPQKMIADLSEQGVKTILITEPFILSSSRKWGEAVENQVLAKNAQGEPYRFDFYFGNTGLIDVFDKNAQQWFWTIYEDLFNQGVAGTWGDLGEPEVHPDDSIHYLSAIEQNVRGDEVHNAYGHQWAKMVYQNQRKLQPETRPFVMMRSGFAGSQRYGMVPWTGDVSRSWGGLQSQVELSLQMGLMGLAYTHSDLGGFAGGEVFDQELYIRWLQYGVFQPVFRPHAQDNIAPEPVFHDKQTKDILREFVKLRYRLMPYLYTMAYQNSTTGMPLMRPLFFDDESNNQFFHEKATYLWGDALLVSPVLQAGETSHPTRLPAGVWFDFWNDTRYLGDQVVNVPVTLDSIPVLARAGAFIPMVKDMKTSREYSSAELTLHYYHDSSIENSQGEMVEDDGESYSALQTETFDHLTFAALSVQEQLTINFTRRGKGYAGMPASRKVNLLVHNFDRQVSQVLWNGQPLADTDITYDADSKRLDIRINWQGSAGELVIK